MNALPRSRDWRLLLLIVCVVAAAWRIWLAEPTAPRADAVRYLDYSVNLLEHGVFGLGRGPPPQPGRANMPLYPAFLALVFKLDGADPAALRCFMARDVSGCSLDPIGAVLSAQAVVLALTLSGIWLLAWLVLGARGAWLALAAALLSGQLSEFAGQLLTENFTLLLFAWLGVTMLFARHGAWGWSFVLGLVLGALTLNRPEFAYLAWAAIGFAALMCLSGRTRRLRVQHAAALVLGTAVLVAPWMARNFEHFGEPALTASYGGRILAQRVQYNRMSDAELAVAFIYWLPDFGDSLARRLFAPALYEKLDFGPDSYYAAGLPYHDALAARLDDETKVPGVILREDVLGHPFRHAAVTLALAWRAVFVGKLWGLIALLAFAATLLLRPDLRLTLLYLSAPAWFLLALYAAVSVSIPRYAICFVPLFALAWAAPFTTARHTT